MQNIMPGPSLWQPATVFLFPPRMQEEKKPVNQAFEDLCYIPHLYSDSRAFRLTNLTLVGRYQFQMVDISSDLPDCSTNEIRRMHLVTETKAGTQNGDRFQSFYLGLNDYLNDHKLKFMAGIEFSEMDAGNDYDGYAIFSALRFYF